MFGKGWRKSYVFNSWNLSRSRKALLLLFCEVLAYVFFTIFSSAAFLLLFGWDFLCKWRKWVFHYLCCIDFPQNVVWFWNLCVCVLAASWHFMLSIFSCISIVFILWFHFRFSSMFDLLQNNSNIQEAFST